MSIVHSIILSSHADRLEIIAMYLDGWKAREIAYNLETTYLLRDDSGSLNIILQFPPEVFSASITVSMHAHAHMHTDSSFHMDACMLST